jgi:hypothetical protein
VAHFAGSSNYSGTDSAPITFTIAKPAVPITPRLGSRRVVSRGGGQTVHDLDHDDLISAVVSSASPVMVALGHATDDLVGARVADTNFPTPTLLFSRVPAAVLEQIRLRARAVPGPADA